MGKSYNFELLDDFIREVKNDDVKRIFLSMQQQQQGETIYASISITALSNDGKTYYIHRQMAAEINPAQATEQQAKEFNEASKKRFDEIIQKFQADYAHAELKVGFCQPFEG